MSPTTNGGPVDLGRIANVSCRASLDWADEGVRPYVVRVDLELEKAGSMTFYRRNLPHLQRDAKRHFVTFVTKNRHVLPEWARDIVLECIRHDESTRYDLNAAVVMPDHAHLILVPRIDEQRQAVISLHEIMKAIKGASAHKINKRLDRHGTVWQEESFDRVLRSSDDIDAKVLYVLENPVRQRLVADWRQYRWVLHRPLPNPYAPPQPT